MAITLDPKAVRAGWQYADNAAAEVRNARSRTTEAAGESMGDLASTLADAAGDLDGALRVALGVLDEHGASTETCINDFLATDGNSAGEFDGLAR